MKARFIEGSTMRHVAVMTATGGVGLFAIFLVDAANLFYISLLGQEELAAAIGYAGATQFFTVSVAIGMAIAAAALVSQAVGAGDRERARRNAASALVITMGALCAAAALVWAFRAEAVALLGAEGRTARIAEDYLAIVLPSLPLLGIGMATSSFLRAVADARRAMYVTLSGGAVGAMLDPLLIFGLGLGVDGAAINTLIARMVIAAVGLYGAIAVHDVVARPRLGDVARDFGPLMKIAAPAVATQLSTPTGAALLTAAASQFGDSAVAGWAVIGRLSGLAFGGLFALSGSIGPILGQNIGAGLVERVRMAYRDALLFCVLYVAVAWAGLIAAAPHVIAGFGLSGAGAELAAAFFYAGAGFYVFTGALFVSNAAFNNLGRPLWSTGFNWLRDAALTPALALVAPMLMGPAGVVAAQALAAVIAGSAAAYVGWRRCGPLARKASARAAPSAAPTPAFASGRVAAAAALGGSEE